MVARGVHGVVNMVFIYFSQSVQAQPSVVVSAVVCERAWAQAMGTATLALTETRQFHCLVTANLLVDAKGWS